MWGIFRDSFHRKLFFALLAVALIPILAASFYYSFLASENSRENLLQGSNLYLGQVSQNIADMVEQTDRVTQMAFADKNLQNVLRTPLQYTAPDRSAIIDQFLLNLNTVAPGASDIIILSGENVYSRHRSATTLSKHFRAFGQSWYYDTILANGGLVVTGTRDSFFERSNRRVITLSRSVLDLSSVGRERLGFLLVEVDSQYLGKLCGTVRDFGESTVVITDSTGKVLYHSNNEFPDKEITLKKELWKQPSGEKTVEFEGQNQMLNYQTDNKTGWKIFHFIPETHIGQLSGEIIGANIMLALFGTLLAAVLAAVIASALARPIKKLRCLVERIGDGELGATEPAEKLGAVRGLAEGINIMSTGLSELLHTNYEMRLESQEAKLRSLQNQINPHFLYNTLNSIQLMAVYKEEREIAQMVSDLGSFFHLVLNSGEDVVPLSKEVRLVELYFNLQKVRFGDRIRMVQNIDQNLLSVPVPKLILQPIVENAMIHGLEDKLEGGEISLKIAKENHSIQIEVSDNGLGMTEEELARCLENLEGKGRSEMGKVSVGMRNVEKRLRLYSGYELGLTIESKKGEGTKVLLSLPEEGVKARNQTEEDYS